MLTKHPTLTSISQIEKYGDYIYYVSQSQIYYIPINDLNAEPKIVKDVSNNTVIVANYFSFYDNKVVANTNNTANIYEIESVGSAPVFKKLYDFETFAKAGFFSNNGNIYLLDNGTLKYFRPNDKTLVTLTNINKDVIDIIDYDNYVWFTTVDGLYKVKKETNAVYELVIGVTETANTLGYFRSPKGLTVKDGKILVCDDVLNCVQEIDPSTNNFTYFAITTESTADYRLTRQASNVVLSENYLYALDNATIKTGEETPQKRIVKVSLDSKNKSYFKIDLSNLYDNNKDFDIKFLTASDTHILIYDGDYITLYEQKYDGDITLEKVVEYQSASATAVCYLDGSFYYSDTARFDYSYDVININKITIPNIDNGLTEIVKEVITENSPEIKGNATCFTVDIFGNLLIAYKDELTSSQYFTRLYNDMTTTPITLTHNVLSMACDFSGNVYMLGDDNKLYKYIENESVFTKEIFNVKTLQEDKALSIALNYNQNDCFYLGSACIYKNTDNTLNIKSLTEICADNAKESEIIKDLKFVTINENAKLFKVELGNYVIKNNKKYFNGITPISNPNTSKIYAVIAEIDSDYFLVSYSNTNIALVRKTSVNTGGNYKADANVISKDKYLEYDIYESDYNYSEYYITNNCGLYSKPIIDDNYKINSIQKNQKVYLVKEITFNNKSMSLIALEKDGEIIGYVPTGYLKTTISTMPLDSETTNLVIGSDANKRFISSIMLMVIAFTITATAMIIESKLLFKNDK